LITPKVEHPMAREYPQNDPNPVRPDREGEHMRDKGGGRPVVGQSRPYVSGANAHGRHEKPRRGGTPGPVMPMAGNKKFTDNQ
jgi:hypothetical protein